MTTIVVSLTGNCSEHGGSGNHLDFTALIDGVPFYWKGVDVSELNKPITEDDKKDFLRLLIRGVRSGKTLNQAKTLLTAGVTVTL